MALIHQASLRPTKLELLNPWLPGRDWYTGPSGEVTWVAAFRFDDPAGEVGIETILVRIGDGPVCQVPLTYRSAPLTGADDWLVGNTEHSVLGKRWVYDACADPVYATALAGAILRNTGQAEQFMQVDGRLERREPTMSITGTVTEGARVPDVGAIERVTDGDPTLIVTGTVELSVSRRLEPGRDVSGAVLTGTWPGQAAPLPLASATLRA